MSNENEENKEKLTIEYEKYSKEQIEDYKFLYCFNDHLLNLLYESIGHINMLHDIFKDSLDNGKRLSKKQKEHLSDILFNAGKNEWFGIIMVESMVKSIENEYLLN